MFRPRIERVDYKEQVLKVEVKTKQVLFLTVLAWRVFISEVACLFNQFSLSGGKDGLLRFPKRKVWRQTLCRFWLPGPRNDPQLRAPIQRPLQSAVEERGRAPRLLPTASERVARHLEQKVPVSVFSWSLRNSNSRQRGNSCEAGGELDRIINVCSKLKPPTRVTSVICKRPEFQSNFSYFEWVCNRLYGFIICLCLHCFSTCVH